MAKRKYPFLLPCCVVFVAVDWMRLLSALCMDIKEMNTCNSLAIQLQLKTDPKDDPVYRLFILYPNDPISIATELFRAWLCKREVIQLSDDQKREHLKTIFKDYLRRYDLIEHIEELFPVSVDKECMNNES